jgi:hypothetical protein
MMRRGTGLGLLALGAALAGCGPAFGDTVKCSCVTFEQTSVTVELSEFDQVSSCTGIPDAYPDRAFERCSEQNSRSVVAPVAMAALLRGTSAADRAGRQYAANYRGVTARP